MKKQQLNQIENFVKDCNEKNKVHNEEYVMNVTHFDRNGYAVKIEYRLFFSIDMKKLIEIVTDNGISMRLGTYDIKQLAYIELL